MKYIHILMENIFVSDFYSCEIFFDPDSVLVVFNVSILFVRRVILRS